MTRQSVLNPMLATLAAVALGACYANIEVRGYIPDEELVQRVSTGLPKSEVEVVLGAPSATATFSRPEIWYYISRRVERVAFMDEKLLDQRVLEVEFDQGGKVTAVRHYSAEDRRPIIPIERVTPTSGKEIGVLESLFGNVGRFNKVEEQSARRLPDPVR